MRIRGGVIQGLGLWYLQGHSGGHLHSRQPRRAKEHRELCQGSFLRSKTGKQVTSTHIHWLDDKDFLKKNLEFIYLFLERGGERKRGKETSIWERNIDQLPLIHFLTRNWTHSPGRCLDQELNRQRFALWDDDQPTDPHGSRLDNGLMAASNLRGCWGM